AGVPVVRAPPRRTAGCVARCIAVRAFRAQDRTDSLWRRGCLPRFEGTVGGGVRGARPRRQGGCRSAVHPGLGPLTISPIRRNSSPVVGEWGGHGLGVRVLLEHDEPQRVAGG